VILGRKEREEGRGRREEDGEGRRRGRGDCSVFEKPANPFFFR
jgi:hypothetical protein